MAVKYTSMLPINRMAALAVPAAADIFRATAVVTVRTVLALQAARVVLAKARPRVNFMKPQERYMLVAADRSKASGALVGAGMAERHSTSRAFLERLILAEAAVVHRARRRALEVRVLLFSAIIVRHEGDCMNEYAIIEN